MVAPDFGEHLINRKSVSPRPFTNTFELSDLPFFALRTQHSILNVMAAAFNRC